MATVWIQEYNDLALGRGGDYSDYVQEPSLNAINAAAHKTVTIGGTSADSSAFYANTHFVRIWGDAIFKFEVNAYNTAKDADANSRRVAANTELILAVSPGGFISVITSA